MKSETVEVDSSLRTFILIKFTREHQYILPIELGLDMLRALSNASRLVSDWNKPEVISNESESIDIRFMSLDDINEIKLKESLTNP